MRARPGRAGLVVSGAAGGDWSSLSWPRAPNRKGPQQPHRGLGEAPESPQPLATSAWGQVSNQVDFLILIIF